MVANSEKSLAGWAAELNLLILFWPYRPAAEERRDLEGGRRKKRQAWENEGGLSVGDGLREDQHLETWSPGKEDTFVFLLCAEL